jgi:hypothetical protein
MVVLADNDIIFKLARCRLLNYLRAWLGCPPCEIRVLPALKAIGRKKLADDDDALAVFEEFLSHVDVIPSADFSILARYAALDIGEQQLLAVFTASENATLVSGDKRALRTIATLAQRDEVLAKRLAGRVECLESVLLGLIDAYGFVAVNRGAYVGRDSDGVLKLAFGPRRTQTHAQDALRSWLADLRSDVGFVVER